MQIVLKRLRSGISHQNSKISTHIDLEHIKEDGQLTTLKVWNYLESRDSSSEFYFTTQLF